MSLLSTGDLARMQTVLNQSLPGTAYVLRATTASDGQGGQTATWGTAGTAACRLSPHSARAAGSEGVVGERVAAFNERVITLPASTDVRQTDRLAVGSQTFEVTGLHAPRSWEISVRVDAVQIA